MVGVLTIAKKDLLLLVRDRIGLFWALVFPLIYGLFFGAVMGGMDDDGGSPAISIALVNEDVGNEAEALAQRLTESTALNVRTMVTIDDQPTPITRDTAHDLVRRGRLAAYVVIPAGYSEGATPWGGGETPEIEIGVDPSRQAESGMLQGLVMEAAFMGMQDLFSNPANMKDAVAEGKAALEGDSEDMTTEQESTLSGLYGALDSFYDLMESDESFGAEGEMAFEPATVKVEAVTREAGPTPSSFAISFPQAVSWGLIGCASGFAVTLVTERTEGTFMRLLLSPQTAERVLLGKALACLISCVGVSTLLLLFGSVALGVRIGNPLGLAVSVLCIGVCFVGIMMFVSTLGRTPNGVAGASWGIMLFCAMIGGGMIPLFVMPSWMQSIAVVSPVRWSIHSMEGAIWRASPWSDLAIAWAVLLGIGVVGFFAGARILRRAAI